MNEERPQKEHTHHHHHHHTGSCSHGHGVGNGHSVGRLERQTLRAMLTALALNAAFVGIELFGAYWTDSVAILADAVHDTGDTLVIGLNVLLVVMSLKPANGNFSYGYKRLSLFGALITGIVLIAGSCYILAESAERFYNPHQPIPQGMFLLSILGIVTNAIAFKKLHGGRSLTERAMKLHLLEDVFGWIGVLVVSIAIWINSGLAILDPIVSVLISSYIMYKASLTVWPVIKLLLEGKPDNILVDEIVQSVKQITHVDDIHDIHIWSLDGISHVMTCHVVVQPAITLEEAMAVNRQVRKVLEQRRIWHSTIELELLGSDCDFEKLHR
jgi:cobalt-zinc-cadmium efflux system protein